MKTKKPSKLTRWIIKLPPTKTLWLFGLFLPMYLIWLRQVGLFTIEKNGNNNAVFNILSAFLVVAVFIVFIIGYGLQIYGKEIPDRVHLLVPLIMLSIWFTCNGIIGKNMIDYENKNNEYFYGLNRIKEYVFRFFHLFYFPLSIYWLQMEVNKYIEGN